MSGVRIAAAVLLAAACAAGAEGSAVITIVNANDPGVGFNDPTPAAPVGGNTGTTVGAQRLRAFQYAASLWGALLDSSAEIRIQATFEPLDCEADNGTLGSAGPTSALADFPNAPIPHTWYAVALASRLAGYDLLPGTGAAEIRARFNSSVGTTGCLESSRWYYGLDNQHGAALDLVSVLLHEFAHGLGFLTFVDPATGEEFNGVSDVFERHVRDDSLGRNWDTMTDSERQASAIRTGSVAWDSPRVTDAVPSTLSGPTLSVTAPPGIAGNFDVGTAEFGPALTVAGVSGTLVAAEDSSDAAGPSTTDACSALTNAADIEGNVALVDRGTCDFVQKARLAQAAGAIALVIANNVSDPSALGMAGTDPSVTIPTVSVTQADGAMLRTNLAGRISVALRLDPDRRSGADAAGRMLLYAPNPVQDGSSISHWDSSAYPHLLMQPNDAGDLLHQVDLTLPMLQDIGWAPAPPPPAGKPRETVVEATRDRGDSPRAVAPRP